MFQKVVGPHFITPKRWIGAKRALKRPQRHGGNANSHKQFTLFTDLYYSNLYVPTCKPHTWTVMAER